MALEDSWYSASARALVEHIVVETQLYDSKHKRAVRFPTQQRALSDAGRGASCNGWPRQDGNAYDTIRHIIGVHPVEVKIPFILRDIPVPSVQPAAK